MSNDESRLDAIEAELWEITRSASRDGDDHPDDAGNVVAAKAREHEYQVVDGDDLRTGPLDTPDRYAVQYAADRDDGPLDVDDLLSDAPMNDDGTIDFREIGFHAGPKPGVEHPDSS